MLVGVPKEIKDNEYRVGIVPSTVRELAEKGHTVMIETQAGAGADSRMPTIEAQVERSYSLATTYSAALNLS